MLSWSGSALACWAPELLVASILGTLHATHHTHGEAELCENSNPKDPNCQFPFERLHESPPQHSMLSYQVVWSAVRLPMGVVPLSTP